MQPAARSDPVDTQGPVVRTRQGFRVNPDVQVPSGLRLGSPGHLLVGKGADIDGGLFCAGPISLQGDVTVRGPVRATGAVVIGPRCRAATVESGSDVRILPGARVQGDIMAAGDVHLFDGATVTGSVTAMGDVIVWGEARTGPLLPQGRVRSEPFDRPIIEADELDQHILDLVEDAMDPFADEAAEVVDLKELHDELGAEARWRTPDGDDDAAA